MRSFIMVLKNDLWRLLEHKSRIYLFLFLMTAAIGAALFMNTKADIAGNIVIVSENNRASLSADTGYSSSPWLKTTFLEEAPPFSELVSGKYDAVVTFDENGTYDIQTIKSDEFKTTLSSVLADPSGYHTDTLNARGAGTNIVGFLIMFIMMQGVNMMFMFAEDKEKKQINRVAASPVSLTGYLCAHSFMAFAFLLVPALGILYIIKFLFNMAVGFSFLQFFFLIFLISALATSFSLALHAFIKKSDSALMLGSAVVVLTSILAGGFYAFDKGNDILETIIKILPQKAYLTLSDLLEKGDSIWAWGPYGFYVGILTLLFFAAAVFKTRRDYLRG